MSKVKTRPDDVTALVSSIVHSPMTQNLLNAHGLKAHSVTWEDTARSKGSCWGPNISDMTLVVKGGNRLMPVIRKPNFSDVTYDVPIETFKLRVGNQEEKSDSKVIELKEYLQNLSTYTDNKHSVNLTDERDSVVLTSSQCCILPVKKGDIIEFAVQLFNYQSYDEDPAVLVVLVTKDGVSTQILEKSNQKLFFNDNGKARWFSAERLQDMRERKTGKKQKKVKSFKEMKEDEKLENVLMMIQVPLKQKPKPRVNYAAAMCFNSSSFGGGAGGQEMVYGEEEYDEDEEDEEDCSFSLFDSPVNESFCKPPVYRSLIHQHVKGHGMDMGMLGLGSEEGKFIGTKNLKFERDTRFPIRCTFQYYRVTDENYVSEHDVKDISTQVSQATRIALASGSLVASTTDRKTEPVLNKQQPSDNPFGKLEERNYLNKIQQNATSTWGSQSMVSFM